MGTTRLFFTASVEELWRSVAGPWLKSHAQTAWRDLRPTVVLTPGRAESFYLRNRLLDEGVTFLGLRFWTPSDARKFLLGEMGSAIGVSPATQAELRLVARVSAERLIRRGSSAAATLASVAQEPGAFLRAYDLLLGAGWDPGREGAAYGKVLAEEMQSKLAMQDTQSKQDKQARQEIATQAGVHRRLWQGARELKEPLIGNLLMMGFNAMHWPLWDLLKAAVFASEEATVALMAPRTFGQGIDQLWHGSWEEVLGISTEIPEGPVEEIAVSPFAGLSDSYEKGTSGREADRADLSFLVTPELSSQVRAVTLKALEYLKRDSCKRLGIVFPEANGLALGVASELKRLGVPLDDGTGSKTPGIFERRYWQSWIALQEEASVARLMAWLQACEAGNVSSGLKEISAREAADVLESALNETLVDELGFMAARLEEESEKRRAQTVAEFMRHRIKLPEEASLADFLALTRKAILMRGWEEQLARLKIDPPAWLWESRDMLSRRTYLKWLKETTDSKEWSSEGNHFYGKVHLLIYGQLTGQTWSHLILTGLNEGVWPRVFETGTFGSRHELMALNGKARELNRRVIVQGRQGEGHEAVAADKGHCLLPLERQDLALRDLCAALEGTSEAVCLAAMTTEAGRSLLPSDFFNHAYQFATGRALDDGTFRNLATAALEWSERQKRILPMEQEPNPGTIAATLTAYKARRDETQPFGRYEFAFREPPAEPIDLSCKKWEEAWNHPSRVWLEEIVGVSPWPDGQLTWPLAIGTWVHRWLATALKGMVEKETGDFLPLLRRAAEREQVRVRDLTQEARIDLHPWWVHVWSQARSVALGLGEMLEPHLAGKRISSEYTLPAGLKTALPGTERADFLLRGRIDLLLSWPGSTPTQPEGGEFSGELCWVLDFKTGSAQALNAKKIAEGTGLQPVLYALAVQALGASSTSISLLTSNAALKPQVELNAVAGLEPIFQSLDKLHRAGIFGMRDEGENEYGYSPSHPLATRQVAGSVLQAKWELVHGTTAPIEEET